MVGKDVKRRKLINKEIAEIVDKYIAVVKANYNVVAIILFGSYAKGTEHKDSDIDIAVITDDIKTLNTRHFFLVLEYQGLAEKKVRLIVVKDIEKAE